MENRILPNIVKQRKLFVLFLSIISAVTVSAQRVAVTGEILDEEGTPVVGALIVDRDDASTGAVSANDGSFSMHVDPSTTLVVSMTGYVTQEVVPGTRTFISVRLPFDTQLIEDIVVIGYGTLRRRDLTGSVASVGRSVLSDQPVNSLGHALQGRAPGVYVVDNGNPQNNVSLKIRGLGTINDSDPLYVIDGVPTSLGLNAINPADIESIDILKDASATAIYGSQGANGVVMITTQKGRSGDGVLNVNVNLGMSQPTNIPVFLNAAQYAALNNDILRAGGETTNPAWADPSSLGKGTDWIDMMFGNAFRQDYGVSWSGGSPKNSFYVSGGYTDHGGIVNSVTYRRITFQTNGEQKLKPWLRLGENVMLSYEDKRNGSYDLSLVFNSLPTQPVFDADGNFDGPADNTLWYGGTKNQYASSEIDKNQTEDYNLLGSVFAEFSILDGLKFKSLAGVEAKFSYISNLIPQYPYKPIEVPNTSYYRGNTRSMSYLWDNYFTYDKTFCDHYVSVMGGMSLQWGVNDWFNGSKYGFLRDDIHQLDNGKTIASLNGSASEWAIASFMFRANYTFRDKYLITATVRRDGSSRFGANHRWGTFPSFSAAWRISEEGWFDNLGFFSSLKLRAGYGVTGHQKIDDYGFFSAYNTGVYSFNGNVVETLVPHVLPNPDVHWEEVHQTNVGVDIGMWKERLHVTMDVYNKDTRDMLVPMPVPASSGYSDEDVPYINAGKVNNRGLEISIAANILRNRKLDWTADFNIAFNRNKIISLNNDVPISFYGVVHYGNILINAEGHPINSFYGYVMDGLFQNQGDVDGWATQIAGGTAPGDIRFLDLDNNGVINDYDRTYIGNPNPSFTFALNNLLRYGDFDLEIFLQGVYGNDVFNANRIFQESMSSATNQYATVLDRWTGEGTSNTMPRAVLSDPNKNSRISTRFVEDGSYLRLKNLTLGYTLPEHIARKVYLKQFRVYLSCQNLFTLTNYTGFDPEVALNGVDMGNYPVIRTYSIGLDFKF